MNKETEYLLKDKNGETIKKSLKEVKKGQIVSHDLIEDDDDDD